MRKGRSNTKVHWHKAKELAEQGCWMSEGARILKIHHTTALYISRMMGFKWAKCPIPRGVFAQPGRKSYVPRRKPVTGELPVSNESVEYVERLMRLACGD